MMTNQSARKLTIQYTVIQCLYLMNFSAVFTFAAVFLRDRHFNSQEIGLTLALGNISALFAQPFIASLARRSQRFTLNQICALIAGVLLIVQLAMALVPGVFIPVLIVFVLTATLLLTLSPLLNTLCLNMINQGIPVNFGLARGLGSGAFALVSLTLGLAVDRFGVSVAPFSSLGLIVLLVVMILIFPASRPSGIQSGTLAPAGASESSGQPGSILKRYAGLPLILAGLMFLLTNQSMYSSYLINIVESTGGTSKTLGLISFASAGLEIPVMVFFSRMAGKIPSRRLLRLSSLFFIGKALVTFFVVSTTQLLFTQVLQMGAYALYVPASIFYINSIMNPRDSMSGQSFMAMTATLGSILGNILGGILLDLSNVKTMLGVAFGFSLLGAAMLSTGIWRNIHGHKKNAPDNVMY